MRRLTARSVPLLLSVVLLAACSGGSTAPDAPALGRMQGGAEAPLPAPSHVPRCSQPSAGQLFAPVDAETLGFDTARLDEAIRFGQQLGSTSIRVYRYGCLAKETELDPATYAVPHLLASASKTVLSLAVGRAVTLGYLELSDPIGMYLRQADAGHGALTVRQLLNQVSGLEVVMADEFAGLATDPVQAVLAQEFWYEPGTEFMYAQQTLIVLARVVELATGKDFQDFLQQELMDPIGIPRDHWIGLRDRSGNTFTFGGLFMRPDDQARLGHLMLHQGRWSGTQLISESYMRQATTGTQANPGHGFLIWLNAGDIHKGSRIGRPLPVEQPLFPGSPRDTYGALGAGGQMTVVIPSRHLVIVRNGGPGGGLSTVEGVDYKEFVRLVAASIADMPAVTDPGPYSYPAPPSQFSPTELDLDVADWNLLGNFLGIGKGTMPGCTVAWCNNRNPVDDLGSLGTDVVQQLVAAVQGTATDLAAGRQYAEVAESILPLDARAALSLEPELRGDLSHRRDGLQPLPRSG